MKIFKRIGLIALAVLIGVGSLFITLPNKKKQYANADTTSFTGLQFLSSDILFSSVLYNSSSNPPKPFSQLNSSSSSTTDYNWYMFSFRIRQSDENPRYFYFSQTALNLIKSASYPKIGYSDFDLNENTWLSYYLSNDLDSYNNYSNIKWSSNYFVDTGNGSTNGYTYFGYSLTGGNFDFNDPVSTAPTLIMKSVEIGNSFDFKEKAGLDTWFDSSDTIYNSTIVSYVDTNDYRFTFFIPNAGSSSSDTYIYEYRKYYFATPQLDNQEAYNQGFNDGLTQGYAEGETVGYREGSTQGYNQGYDAGKIDGANSAGEYTFLSLIGAVVDAPVSVFKSMFNFNLLGVNLRDFFLAILTFCGITMLIRFALAKG